MLFLCLFQGKRSGKRRWNGALVATMSETRLGCCCVSSFTTVWRRTALQRVHRRTHWWKREHRQVGEEGTNFWVFTNNLDTGTILGSENCQSISFQNLLSASHLFMCCDITLSIETVLKAAAINLPDYCTPITYQWCHYGQINIQGYKVKVPSEKMSASHLSSQPVMMTGVWNSLCLQGHKYFN